MVNSSNSYFLSQIRALHHLFLLLLISSFMESYIKSGHEGVVSTWFSFSTISCWHWTSTSVFVVTVTPSCCSPHCIPSLWTCHFSVSRQRNTFCWGSAISVLCSQTPSLLIHLYFSTSHRPWTSARNCHMTSFHLEFLSTTGALWLSQERNMAKATWPLRDPVASNRCFPTPALTCLLENFPPHPLTYESFSSFAFSASLSPCFSVSLVDFPLYPWCLLFLLSLTYRTSLMLVLSFTLFSCHRILFLLSYDFNFHFFVTPKSQFLFFIFLLDPSL